MGILDKLVEKKDILAYCDFRIQQIRQSIKMLPLNCKPKSRERAQVKLEAKIQELKHIKAVIGKGIKAESIKLSLEVYKYNNGKRVNDTK